MPGSIIKAELRRRVWDLLTRAGVVGFPGAHGRTPTFAGAAIAVERLQAHAIWRDAARILVLSEPVLAPARRAVVADGKVLVGPDGAPTTGWVVEIDPAVAGPARAQDLAASFDAAILEPPRGVRCLHGREIAPLDLMVIGAVCVDLHGARVGKGTGEADIVYALGRSRRFLSEETPVAVIVHEMQICDEPGTHEPTDLPIDYIVTPREIRPVSGLHIRPNGLDPAVITPQRVALFPGLAGVLEREGLEVPLRKPGQRSGARTAGTPPVQPG
jgi:5-formyltetrahydrofolate cyclo-ligase